MNATFTIALFKAQESKGELVNNDRKNRSSQCAMLQTADEKKVMDCVSVYDAAHRALVIASLSIFCLKMMILRFGAFALLLQGRHVSLQHHRHAGEKNKTKHGCEFSHVCSRDVIWGRKMRELITIYVSVSNSVG